MYSIQKIEQEIIQALGAAIGKQYRPSVSELTIPPDPKWGEFAFPCFGIAKGLGRSPFEIASELAPKITPKGIIKNVDARSPYVNIFIDITKLTTLVLREIELASERYGMVRGNKRHVMVEYSGLNTHKPVHIGHIRNLLFGAAVVRLMRSQGTKVIAADFVNDLGLHVAQWLVGYQKFFNGEKPPRVGRGRWLSEVYTKSVAAYETDPEFKTEVMTALAKLQAGDRLLMRLWKKTRAWSLADFDQVHRELNAVFDAFYAESSFVDARMTIVKDLVARGIAIVSEGATIVNLEDVGLGIQVILRSDGTALYATTDLALAEQKVKDKKLDASYIITDARQKLHFAQLFETLHRAGYEQEMKHLAYEFVTLPGGAMSSRKGTIVLYEEFRDEMLNASAEETRTRHPEWPDKKIKTTAHSITAAALAFDMLKQDSEKKIVFDVKSALSFDGMSGPYVQYMGARIVNILKHAPRLNDHTKNSTPTDIDASERALVLALARFPEVLHVAASDLRPSHLAEYLFQLAKTFGEFYETSPVLKASPKRRTFRLRLICAVRVVLENGVDILGFELPQSM